MANNHPTGHGPGRRPVRQAAPTRRPQPSRSRSTSRPSNGAYVRPQRTAAAAGSPCARPRRARKRSVLPVVIAVVIVAISVFAIVRFAFPLFLGDRGSSAHIEAGQEVMLTIPAGASGDTIASILSEKHVIEDPGDYYAAVKKLNAEMSLKPGDYRFETLQDPLKVVRQLVEGPNLDTGKLVVPEGKTVSQTAAIVEQTFGIPAQDFNDAARASSYVEDYPFLQQAASDSLEGFLFPKTYHFADTPTSDQIIRAMLDQFKTEVWDVFDFSARRAVLKDRYGVDLSDYQLLTLASVIEREAITDAQRYKVSSVFFNRMHQGMPLQSDATMMYVTGGEVTAEDLKKESPYNTYLNPSLPPTPICAPSTESIKAALEPADTDYLYFFITSDTERFSQTHEQHLQVIKEHS